MKHAPRPASRVLLAGHFAVARSALLARPEGPVNGIDLSRGAPVVLELLPTGDGEARALEPGVLEVRRHRGGLVVASRPAPRERPIRDDAPAPVRRRRWGGSVRGELGSRRVRVTAIAAAGVACLLLAAALLDGSHAGGAATARAAAPAVLRPLVAVPQAPVARRPVAAPAHRAATVQPSARGGAARVLVAAPRAHPRPAPRPARPSEPRPVRRSVLRARPSPPSTGWVAGLFVGTN